MNVAVATKSRSKIINPQSEKASPVPRRTAKKQSSPWVAVIFFVALVATLALLFSPNEPKSVKDTVQTEKPLSSFGNKVLSR